MRINQSNLVEMKVNACVSSEVEVFPFLYMAKEREKLQVSLSFPARDMRVSICFCINKCHRLGALEVDRSRREVGISRRQWAIPNYEQTEKPHC